VLLPLGEGWDGGKINKKMALELLLKTDTHIKI
jgi:hypothetical protein